jgi:hypothetical protein
MFTIPLKHKLVVLLLFVCAATSNIFSQRLTALHGSSYAGSLAKDYNPAAILNAPDRWDLTLFALQYRNITNAIAFDNLSLLKQPDTIVYHTYEGTQKKYAHIANTIQLLHFRYRLDIRSAFSIGVNLRTYAHAHTGPFYFSDTMSNLNDFLIGNMNTEKYFGNGQTSNWLEYSFAYSRVLSSNELGRLQGGVELRVMKSLAGAYGRINNIRLSQQAGSNPPQFYVSDINGEAAYSANIDELNNNKASTVSPFKSFMKASKMNVGINLGVEYTRYYDEMDGGDRSITDYNWKLGASLLDLGKNTYLYSKNSYGFSGVNGNISSNQVDAAVSNNSNSLKDSIKAWSQNFDTLQGQFAINNPARLLINFDKSFEHNFYVNAEAQLHFGSSSSAQRLNTRETSAVAITPRWETKSFGAYLPFQYTTQGNFWVGLGIKAGPLVLGLDNIGWLVNKKSMPNGGLYMAIQIRPGKNKEKDAMPCPE